MKHIELRPDRRLLKANFDGYKLSLDPIPVLRMELAEHNRPHRVRPTEQQFSYYHARLFGMQNHLVRDPWATGQCYYVDASGMVQRVHYDETLGRLKPVSAVYKLPTAITEPPTLEGDQATDGEESKTAGTYNCSLVFASEKYCLVSDGRGTIRVLDTGDRTAGRDWKARGVFQPAADDSSSGFPAGGFTLLDARFLVQDGKKQIHCVVLQVEHHLERKSETLLYWLTLEQQQQTPECQKPAQEWTLRASRLLRGGGFPRYCALDYRATGLLLASDKPFRFVFDSERPVEQSVEAPAKASETVAEEPPAHETYPFEWHQTLDEVVIKFVRQEGVHYQVETKPSSDGLCVFANDCAVVEGTKLFAKIDGDCTVWTMDRETLEITMQKQAPSVMWPFLFPGGPDEVPGGGGTGEGNQAIDLPPASSLDAALEDCDFGEAGEAEEYFALERLATESHQVSHHISLGSVPPLFSVTLRAGQPAAIVLRQDVDACLWQLQPQASPDACQMQHEGTLHAFGYVQASKRQQKFLACSPDFGYAVICESERRLFIYKGSYGGAGAGLRNRNGPQVSLGQQRLVSLDDAGEILGICCEKEVTLLMTETALITLQLGIEE
ncbi:AGAP000648-PA-like protein [Anopheles sinensis]|uniref:NudC domain-containing protein 1 n=1 Tax=Anopheles sinensis TaxID=74873 RepID=A0A084VLQ1_ANOSI|nr:AGAP000648-PA-like protein [Anopheles sinensis]